MSTYSPKRSTTGISIISSCMVIVVTALALAALLSSQTLVRTAELRSVIIQAKSYTAAYQTFRGKYGSVPGDYPLAVGHWGGITTDGNGDGLIHGWREEEVRAWQHIVLARILPATRENLDEAALDHAIPGVNIPASDIPNAGFLLSSATMPIYGKSGGNLLELGGVDSTKATLLDKGAVNAAGAKAVDEKMDDGLPDTGAIVTLNAVDMHDCILTNQASASYLVSSDAISCRMVFWLD